MNALGLLVAAAVAQTPPAVDVTKSLSKMSVITDGKQHYIAYVKGDGPVPDEAFWGDGKTFYRIPKSGGGAAGSETWYLLFDDPRDMINRGQIAMRDSGKTFEVKCKGKQAYQLVPPEIAADMISAATFLESRWQRRWVALLRDDKGVYYFVDQQRGSGRERRDLRVFVGPRGQMAQQSLQDAADDTAGLVLKTKNGELRLVISPPPEEGAPPPIPSKWVKGKVTTELTRLDLEHVRNATLVMNDLGVYAGVIIGTPCDETP